MKEKIARLYHVHARWMLPIGVAVAVFILAQIALYALVVLQDNPLPSTGAWNVYIPHTKDTLAGGVALDDSLTAEVVIDRLGINVPIIWSTSTKDRDLEKDLEHGAIHYPGTPKPGENGNSFITAHSSDYPWKAGAYKQAFVALGKVNIGDDDIMVVYKKDGVPMYKAQFKVMQKEVVKSTDIRMIEQKDTPEITLATCWPIGTSWKRLMVKAELVSLTKV